MRPNVPSVLAAAAILAVAGCETQDPIGPGPSLNAAPTVVSSAALFDEFGTGSGISGTATLTARRMACGSMSPPTAWSRATPIRSGG